MPLRKKEKMATMIGMIFFILFIAGLVLGIYFLGFAGIFELLGVQYHSIWSLFVFAVCFFMAGFIIELFSKPIFERSTRNVSGKIKLVFIQICFESVSNWLVLFTVDEFMQKINLSSKTELLIALFVSVFEIILENNNDDDGNKKNPI
ncbi:hypothetical protein GCM10008986_18690 [Salinibacillus aidingensis]|uniref:Regulatory protein YrvL n=2 Tax=Salinibacillus aidingensis TaxID=237684 RepID=A0ABP3L3F3_9BACI